MKRESSRGGSKRRVWVLVGVLILLALAYKPAQTRLAERLALEGETLGDEEFRQMARSSFRPRQFVLETWRTGKVPHRQAVMRLLKDLGEAPLLEPANRGEVFTSALSDADLTVREIALAALRARKEEGEVAAGAVRQLRDLDPQARLLGLEYLRGNTNKLTAPMLLEMAEDPDKIVAANAMVMLQKRSGQSFDFTVRALAENPDDPAAVKALQESAARAREWWEARNQGAPAARVDLSPLPPEPGGVAADFELADLDGQAARLSDYRGKIVLLNFWATWCAACRAEFPILKDLNATLTNDFVILGISLDGANGEYFTSGTQEERPPDGASEAAEILQEVRRSAKTHGLKHRILLDPRGEIGARFNGGELPTNVLIDGDGRLRRRFVGPRSAAVFEAMIAEIRAN